MFINQILWKEVTKRDRDLWTQTMTIAMATRSYIDSLGKPRPRIDFECHSICRALQKLIPGLKLVDGVYSGIFIKREKGKKPFYEIHECSHSWLVTPDGAIIDPYPVGAVSLHGFLVGRSKKYGQWGHMLYVARPSIRKTLNMRAVQMKTKKLTAFMRQAMKHQKKAS